MLDTFEWWIFSSFCEVKLRCGKEFLAKNNFLFVRQLKYSFICMFIVMGILVSAFEQMAMLMFYLSHNLHSTPLIHLLGQSVLIGEIISIPFFVLHRMFVEFSGYCLAANVGSDCSFVVNKTFNDWNHVSKLCANIHNQTTLQRKKISWKHCWFVHKKTIEFVGLVEKLDKFLSVLFAAEGRLDIKKGVLGGVDKHFFSEGKTGQSLESLPVFNETVFEDGLGVRVLFGERGVEIELGFFGGDGILLYEGWYDDFGFFFSSEPHFGV